MIEIFRSLTRGLIYRSSIDLIKCNNHYNILLPLSPSLLIQRTTGTYYKLRLSNLASEHIDIRQHVTVP